MAPFAQLADSQLKNSSAQRYDLH